MTLPSETRRFIRPRSRRSCDLRPIGAQIAYAYDPGARLQRLETREHAIAPATGPERVIAERRPADASVWASSPIWLEPYPDVLLEGSPTARRRPTRYETTEAIGLAS